MTTVSIEKWGWKELASTIVDDHHRDGQSATFIFSGAQVAIYMGDLVVKDIEAEREWNEGEHKMMVVGERLSKRALRKYFWDQFAGMNSPEDAGKLLVVWTAYDETTDTSWVGLGKAVRQMENV